MSISSHDAERFRRLEPVCDQFEAAWAEALEGTSRRPQLETFLEVTEIDRRKLLEELVAIDLTFRQRVGEHPQPDDYQLRFDDEQDRLLIARAFDRACAGSLQKETAEEAGHKAQIDDEPSPARGDQTATGVAWPRIPGYEIVGELGHGGMGVVYRARDLRLGRTVALKMILSGPRANSGEQLRFAREAQFLAQLHNPNIVQIYEVGEHLGQHYLALEFVEGGTLHEKVGTHSQPPRDAARLVAKLARAVHVTHQLNIIHRDLKPHNVLLTADNEPKITDFGLAKELVNEPSYTRTGTIIGTPGYMAPEQAGLRGATVGRSTDVYGLGAILFYLLAGKPPFDGDSVVDTIRQVVEDRAALPAETTVDRDLGTITMKSLEKQPDSRYASAEELAMELERFLSGESIKARPAGTAERSLRWCRRNPMVAALSIVSALLLVTGAIISVTFAIIANQRAQQAELAAYKSDLLAIQSAWNDANVGMAARLLSKYENRRDLIGFEWHHLRSLFNSHVKLNHSDEMRHHEAVNGVTCSRDNRYIASAGVDDVAHIWDAQTGKLLHTLDGHDDNVNAVAFDRDGHVLATSSKDNTIKLWNVTTGKLIKTLAGHKDETTGIAFDPSYPTRLASASYDGFALIWNTESGEIVRRFDRRGTRVTSVAFSADGSLIAIADEDKNLLIGDPANNNDLDHLVVPRSKNRSLGRLRLYLSNIAFSKTGTLLAGASQDHNVYVWDLEEDKQYTLEGHTGFVNSVEFNRDGSRLVSSSYDNTIRVWDVHEEEMLFVLRGDLGGAIADATFGRDDQHVISAGADGGVKVWDARYGQQPVTITNRTYMEPYGRDFPSNVRSLALHPDGTQLAVACLGSAIKVCDLTTRKTLLSLRHEGPRGLITSVAYSRDGNSLVSVRRYDENERHQTNSIAVWNARTGAQLFVVHEVINWGKEFYVPSAVFHPDGRSVYSAGAGNTVKAWSLETHQEILRLEGHTAPVESMAVSRNGRWLAYGDRAGTIVIWDLDESLALPPFKAHERFVRGLHFSPDSRRLASAGGDKDVRLWDVASGEEVLTLRGHTSEVFTVAFSPDGKRLATAGEDRAVRIWHAETGDELLAIRGHTSQVSALEFTPGGKQLVSGALDQTVIIWGTELPAPSFEVSLDLRDEADHVERAAWFGKAESKAENYRKAIDLYERLGRLEPNDSSVTARWLFCRMMMARLQATSGKIEEAVAEAELVLDHSEVDSLTLYQAACLYAFASKAAKEPGYGTSAVEILRRAIRQGLLKDPSLDDNVPGDSKLDPIRERDDFRALFEKP